MKKAIIKALEPVTRLYGAISCLPSRFRRPKISPPAHVAHGQWPTYLSEQFNKAGFRVLEIGSRNVTGVNLRDSFDKAEYVGFDFMAGENVDVVGDCHQLSSFFGPEERFDLIFSSAVFEHLYMPWTVVEEIHKLLRVGGHVFVETHFSFCSHERPWHFFQFSDMGLRALFNEAMGFSLVDKGMSNPMFGYFDAQAVGYLRYRPVAELYCHSEILCRKTREIEKFDWRKIDIDAMVDGTRYPRMAQPTSR